MMNNEQYENLIVLMKEVLNYYANEHNYSLNYSTNSIPIQLDKGFQARQAIATVDSIFSQQKEMENQYLQLKEDNDENPMLEQINKLIELANEQDGEDNDI